MIENCPNCKVDFIDQYDDKTYYRVIGLEYPHLYDGISYWKCPDCKHIWKAMPWVPDHGELNEDQV